MKWWLKKQSQLSNYPQEIFCYKFDLSLLQQFALIVVKSCRYVFNSRLTQLIQQEAIFYWLHMHTIFNKFSYIWSLSMFLSSSGLAWPLTFESFMEVLFFVIVIKFVFLGPSYFLNIWLCYKYECIVRSVVSFLVRCYVDLLFLLTRYVPGSISLFFT